MLSRTAAVIVPLGGVDVPLPQLAPQKIIATCGVAIIGPLLSLVVTEFDVVKISDSSRRVSSVSHEYGKRRFGMDRRRIRAPDTDLCNRSQCAISTPRGSKEKRLIGKRGSGRLRGGKP